MLEISSELRQFKSSVETKIDGMNSICNNLQSAISDIESISTSSRGDIGNYYDSKNKELVVGQLDSIHNVFDKISSSISSDLSSMISEAQSIISYIKKLNTIAEEAEEQQKIVNSISKDDEKRAVYRNKALTALDGKKQEFQTLHTEVEEKLAKLKQKDSEISFVSEFESASSVDQSSLEYGIFEYKTFTASNGVKMGYYIYVPKYDEEVKKLPVMLYMHGIGFENKGKNIVTYGGLGEAIANKTVTPSGIVVMPHVINGYNYENKDFRDALAELPLKICEEYDGDKNRISVGGVSYGAVTSYRLINEHPNTFSAVVTACGANDVTSAFNGVKAWNFNGRNEADNHTGRKYTQRQTEEVNKAGGTAIFTPLEDVWAHTKIGSLVFQNKYVDEETGEEIYPFEWAFKQIKKNMMNA